MALRPLAMAVTAVPGVVVEADLQICLGGAMATVLPPSGRSGAVVAAFPLKENLRRTVGVGFLVFFHFILLPESIFILLFHLCVTLLPLRLSTENSS